MSIAKPFAAGASIGLASCGGGTEAGCPRGCWRHPAVIEVERALPKATLAR